MQIIFVFVCRSFTQSDHHDFILTEEEPETQNPSFNLTLSVLNEQITSNPMSIPAVFPGRPDVFQFVVSHVFYGEHKHVSVDVCTFTQLRGGRNTKGCFNQSHNYCDDINVSFRPGNKQSIILNKSIFSRGNMPISDSVGP